MHAGAPARPGRRRGEGTLPPRAAPGASNQVAARSPGLTSFARGRLPCPGAGRGQACPFWELRPQDRRCQMEGQGWGQGLASSPSRSPLPRTSAQATGSRAPRRPGQAASEGGGRGGVPPTPRSPYLVGRRHGKPSWGTRRRKPRTGPEGKQRVGQLHEESETRAAMSTAAPFLCPPATGGSHGFPQTSSQATVSHKPQWNGPGSHSKPGRSLAQELGRVPTQPLVRWPREHQQRQGGRGGRRGGRKLAPDPLIDWFQQL